MTHAYDNTYLEHARTNLGRMLDFATHDLNLELASFFDMFLASGVADRFEDGDPTILAGMSGVELAYDVLERSGIEPQQQRQTPRYPMSRSEEYWTGWALADYQWRTSLRFADITARIPIERIRDLYNPYHEMDIRQFRDHMDEAYRNADPRTNLKLLRERAGLSQSQLSQQSGIPVRTIQQYEQRQKNINKAQAESLVRLATPLCCTVEELLEKVP